MDMQQHRYIDIFNLKLSPPKTLQGTNTFLIHSIEEMSGGVYTDCPACESKNTAMHYDGNHKLFRYKKR